MDLTGQTLSINIEEATTPHIPSNPLEVTLDTLLRDLPGRRQVWSAHCKGTQALPPLLIKRYTPHSHQERDRQREWTNLKKLYALGLTLPPPLFTGQEADGTTIVALRYIKDARTLRDSLFDNSPEAASKPQQGHLFRRLLETLGVQHRAGVWQSDPHLENFLWQPPHLYALDAAGFRFHHCPKRLGLNHRTRVHNLAQIFIQVPYTYESELWDAIPAYLQHHPHLSVTRLSQSLRRRLPLHRKRRLVRYIKKTQRSCSAFEHSHFHNRHLLCDRKLPTTLKTHLCRDPDNLIAQGKIIKNGTTATVAEIHSEDGQTYILKRYNPKPVSYRLSHICTHSRARRSWINGNAWRLLGLPTPRPWACVEEKQGPFTVRSFLLTAKDTGKTLLEFARQHQHHPQTLYATAVAFTHVWHAWRALRAVHGDLKATNILVDPQGQPSFIDLDSFHFFLPPILYRARFKKDLHRFMQNWHNNPAVAVIFSKALF